MAYTNNKTDIGTVLGRLCVIGSGESVMGAFGEAVMNAALPTVQAGGNASRANIGWHVEAGGEHHVFLNLEYGYDNWKHLAEKVKKETRTM